MSLRLTNEEINIFLIRIIRSILIAGGEANPRVIESHQNKPAPKTPYITVGYTGIGRRIGEVNRTALVEIGETGEFERYLFQDNEKVFTITEEGGDGSLLEFIRDSLELSTVQAVFNENNISLMRVDDVMPKPTVMNDDWIKSSTFDVTLGIASGLKESANYIENVEMSGAVENPT